MELASVPTPEELAWKQFGSTQVHCWEKRAAHSQHILAAWFFCQSLSVDLFKVLKTQYICHESLSSGNIHCGGQGMVPVCVHNMSVSVYNFQFVFCCCVTSVHYGLSLQRRTGQVQRFCCGKHHPQTESHTHTVLLDQHHCAKRPLIPPLYPSPVQPRLTRQPPTCVVFSVF